VNFSGKVQSMSFECGNKLLKEGRIDEAIDAYKKAIEEIERSLPSNLLFQ
jgi:tetratricopeptide (TPR) repeat protein